MPPRPTSIALERLDAYRWRIPRDERRGMRVDGIVYADDRLMAPLRDDPALVQVANVATLPGIVGASLAMPDIHWGYGFPVGGVAAFGPDGVVSPGGIGFDINCGVRLLRSDLAVADVQPRLAALADALFAAVPSGLGAGGDRRVGGRELDTVLRGGAAWAVEAGEGSPDDLARTEDGGRLAGADPQAVSVRARQRGERQLGTLGSGNHFLEVQAVDRVVDETAATAMGLRAGQVVVMIHCGSRGLGHQVCTDHVAVMDRVARRSAIVLPDRQLACAPLDAPEATAYLGAMAAAANFAWANRQLISAAVRGVFGRQFGPTGALATVYDLSHNLARFERHVLDGHTVEVCVHRKGATRAFGPGHPAVPEPYRRIGQPVLIPGDMGRYSFVGVGTAGALEQTFGSSCHGAGRLLSRHAATRQLRGVDVAGTLAREGIVVRAQRRDLLAEEASVAYKDASVVVEVAQAAGIFRTVARLRPLAVIKG